MPLSVTHKNGLAERSGSARVDYAVKCVTDYMGLNKIEVTFDGKLLVEGKNRYGFHKEQQFFAAYRCTHNRFACKCNASILVSKDVSSGSTSAIVNLAEHEHQRVGPFRIA
jgi:hypothetical protein